MGSDTLDPAGVVRGCSVGCTLAMPEMSLSVFLAAGSRDMGLLELKKCVSKHGCFGCGGNSCFFNVGKARPSVRVRSCRMWFQFDEKNVS